MANNQFLTVGDVYNPVDTEMKIQSINQAKMRNRVDAMKMRELFQQQQRRNKLRSMGNDPRGVFNPISGQFATAQPVGQPIIRPTQPLAPAPSGPAPQGPPPVGLGIPQGAQTPPGGGVAPQPSDEDRAAVRGQKKLEAITRHVQPLIQQAKKDPSARVRINKLTQGLEKDPDNKALIAKAGYDEMKYTMDEDTGEGTYVLAKSWTADELQKYADNAPNGQVLAPLVKHPGNYRIKFNGMGMVTGAEKVVDKVSSMFGDKNLTTSQWIDKSLNDPDPQERQKAKKILKEIGAFEAEKYASKYGATMTEEDYRFAAKQYLKTGKMPPMGRSAYVRAQIMRNARIIAEVRGTSVGQLISRQAGVGALSASLKNVQKQENMMNSFVRNLNAQADRLKETLDVIQRTDARLMNVPIRNFKKRIKGSANEAVLDMYLTEISSEIGKLATGSAASVAELSTSAREKWEEIHDPNLPLSELYKLVMETQNAADLRMKSVRDEKNSIMQDIEGTQPGTQPSKPKRMTFNPETGEFE